MLRRNANANEIEWETNGSERERTRTTRDEKKEGGNPQEKGYLPEKRRELRGNGSRDLTLFSASLPVMFSNVEGYKGRLAA
jgi:hypothetical protein